MKSNPVGWVEIPVTDMTRAITFYNALMGWSLTEMKMGEDIMAWFPYDEKLKGIGGALLKHENYEPSYKGSMIYLSCEDVAIESGRVEAAGGKIIKPKFEIGGGFGFSAIIEDSEGNRVGLHSNA